MDKRLYKSCLNFLDTNVFKNCKDGLDLHYLPIYLRSPKGKKTSFQ